MLTTRIGPVDFTLSSRGVVPSPELQVRQIGLEAEGATVSLLDDPGQACLLVADQRFDSSRETCYAEVWRPSQAPEVPIAGLLVLCDAPPSATASRRLEAMLR